MRVTIKEIAQAANVSRGTVDRVLNNRPYVNQIVRERVQRIAKELGYKTNLAGKALANQNRPAKIGIVLPPSDNPFYQKVLHGIQKAKEDYEHFGLRCIYEIMEEYSVCAQCQALDNIAQENVDGLLIDGIDDDRIREKINESFSGVPIVTVISDIDGIEKCCFVGHDLVKGGRVAACLVGKMLYGEKNVAIITTSKTLQAHKQRIKGFTQKLDECFPEVKVVGVYENLDREDITYETVMHLLKSNEQIGAIYSTAGIGSVGIGRALKETGLENCVKVVTFDLLPETKKLLKQGVIDFTIGQEPQFQGSKAISLLGDLLIKGIAPSTDRITTKVDIRTCENI